MAISSQILHRSAAAFRRALAEWFKSAQRQLPWRRERSLYRTVVSEFMLQQTQVTTVLPYFERWMQVLPDFTALAAADEAVVLKLWEGLGYYRRARSLHQLARELVARNPAAHAAGYKQPGTLPARAGTEIERTTVPRTACEWEGLPGVGPYTAAAIASLAFDDPAACVDGNVVRILARLTNETRAFANGSSAVKHFTPLARELLDARTPGRHNEAMMELGATICVRRNPRCNECPVAKFCAGRKSGYAGNLPRIARAKTERHTVDRIWCVRGDALLLHRIPADAARMRGLHELPTAEQAGVAARMLAADRLLATHRRAITRFQFSERIYRIERATGRALRWVPLAELDDIALSGPHRRWIRALLAGEGPDTPAGRGRRRGAPRSVDS